MTNTMKTIIFIISMFVFILLFIIINALNLSAALLNNPYANVLTNTLYIAGYVLAILTQAFAKQLYTKNQVRTANRIKTVQVSMFAWRDRIILLLLPVLAVMLPLVRQRAFTKSALGGLLSIAALIAIIEILLFIGSKSLRVHFTDRGIAVTGFDIRLELSVPFNYHNAVGYYPYERIVNFLAFNDKVMIYHTYDFGVIEMTCDPEEVKQIKGLLLSKKIPEKKF